MNIINISKQKILNNKNKAFAYELLFQDAQNQETSLSNSIRETSQLIMSSISSK